MRIRELFGKKWMLLLVGILIVGLVCGVSFATTSGTMGTISPGAGGVSGGGIANVTASTSGQPTWNPVAGAAGSITGGDIYEISTVGDQPYTEDIWVGLYLTNPDELIDSYTYITTEMAMTVLATQVTGEAVGTGDGIETVFSLDESPVCPTTLVVKIDGVAQTEATDYTVNYKTGTVTFVAAPADNEAITADYWYYDSAGGAYKPACSGTGKALQETYLTLTNGYVAFLVAGDTTGAEYKLEMPSGSFYCVDTSGTLGPVYYLEVAQS